MSSITNWLNMIKIFLEKHKVLIRQMLLYGIIGLTAAGIDTLVFYLLTKAWPVVLSNIISVNVGITISFFLNAFFNFKKRDRLARRALKFYLIGYAGLALSTLMLYLGVTVLAFGAMPVKLVSVVVVAMLQFITNKLITFKS